MRQFVFKTVTSAKPIMMLDCQSLDTEKAIVPGHVKLDGLKTGMVFRPATDQGRPDMGAVGLIVVSVNQGTEGSPSTIHFQEQPSRASKSPAASKKKEEDQSK